MGHRWVGDVEDVNEEREKEGCNEKRQEKRGNIGNMKGEGGGKGE